MRKIGNQAILRRGLMAWAALSVLVSGCGGGGSSPVAAASSTGTATGASNSGGSSGGGTSGSGSGSGSGGSGGSGTTTSTILFEQPIEGGISGHLAVPPATKTAPPKGAFTLVLWQVNRFSANGELVPAGWDAGTQTGFTPSSAMSAQLGFQNMPGSSTAQMEADTVGAYLNSQDLPQSTTDQKMMITPQFTFQAGSQPIPFANAGGTLGGAVDLQVPTALGSDAYVVADLLFKNSSGVRVSIGIAIFSNGGVAKAAGLKYDVPSNTYILNSPLGIDERFITRASASNLATRTPWVGWQHFEWSMSENQFVSALQSLTAAFPGQVTSTDPTQYFLAEIHLNAEFHTQGQAAELGWSMRGLKVWTTH